MQKLKFAMIGLGNQGLEHLQAALHCKDAQFVCGIDSCEESQQKALQIQPDLLLGSDVTLLTSLQLDGIVLALPHHAYATLWQQLLELKLPILKEKPLARTLQEASQQLKLARTAGCPIQVAIQRRHHPSYVFLKQQLQQQPHSVLEVSAMLHLGFKPSPQSEQSLHDNEKSQESCVKWRNNKQLAGGGALLDAGYHMVDLLHYLVGGFDLVSATLWKNQQLIEENDIEDQVYLIGRTTESWLSLDVQIYSDSKQESITLRTEQDLWQVNREGVWRNDECLMQANKQWQQAMADQLSSFAHNIRQQQWHQEMIWDQLPAMRLIDDAYGLVNRV